MCTQKYLTSSQKGTMAWVAQDTFSLTILEQREQHDLEKKKKSVALEVTSSHSVHDEPGSPAIGFLPVD